MPTLPRHHRQPTLNFLLALQMPSDKPSLLSHTAEVFAALKLLLDWLNHSGGPCVVLERSVRGVVDPISQ